jgi:transposase-like protein
MTVPHQPTRDRRRKQVARADVPEDALRMVLQTLIQETLEAEFTRCLGAAPHERSATRRGWRNSGGV